MKDDDYITLHPEHGVNPTIPVCAYCGKERNEIILLGDAFKNKAPMYSVIDLEPCEECKSKLAQGITLFAIPNDSTFAYIVVKEEAFISFLEANHQPKELIDNVKEKKMCQVDLSLLNQFKAIGKENEERINN